ncbi:hypothetical protein BUALT_Bualt08G0079500 [Buddleja alternifolia]|uniref:Uncharacterized protein n=1 Tax=Buddleja alternifolia TaxID=168488 RepID=A0AAV6X4L1_9LAMI|nr:hypothetical protein BUALT_Bualt08G0079500 [Buddleja alternifolia]
MCRAAHWIIVAAVLSLGGERGPLGKDRSTRCCDTEEVAFPVCLHAFYKDLVADLTIDASFDIGNSNGDGKGEA